MLSRERSSEEILDKVIPPSLIAKSLSVSGTSSCSDEILGNEAHTSFSSAENYMKGSSNFMRG